MYNIIITIMAIALASVAALYQSKADENKKKGETIGRLLRREETEWEDLTPFLSETLTAIRKDGVCGLPAYSPLTKKGKDYVPGIIADDIKVGERAYLRYEPGSDIVTSPVEKILGHGKEPYDWVFIKTRSGSIYLVGNWVF